MTRVSEKITEVEERLAAIGKSHLDLCGAAGVSPSTWNRWKNERVAPRMDTFELVERALETMEASAKRRRCAKPVDRLAG